MDAVEYLKTLDRICRTHQACDGCPILDCGKIGCGVSDSAPIEFVDTVEIVEQWSKEHPERTRQSVFLERYPNARIDEDGSIGIRFRRRTPHRTASGYEPLSTRPILHTGKGSKTAAIHYI